MLDRVKLKAFFVFLTIHAGLVLSIYALYRTAQIPEARGVLGWLIGGTAGLYGGLILGALFLYLPVAPWIRRARRVLAWKTWIQDELPQLLVAVPAVIGALTTIIAAIQQASKSTRAHGPNPIKSGRTKSHKRSKAA